MQKLRLVRNFKHSDRLGQLIVNYQQMPVNMLGLDKM